MSMIYINLLCVLHETWGFNSNIIYIIYYILYKLIINIIFFIYLFLFFFFFIYLLFWSSMLFIYYFGQSH